MLIAGFFTDKGYKKFLWKKVKRWKDAPDFSSMDDVMDDVSLAIQKKSKPVWHRGHIVLWEDLFFPVIRFKSTSGKIISRRVSSKELPLYKVKKIKKGEREGFYVESLSNNVYYTYENKCSCPSYIYRRGLVKGKCKHQAMLAEEFKRLQAAKKLLEKPKPEPAPTDAIVIPEQPIAIRNNCQIGKWTTGVEERGSELAMTILKFSKFFGNLGQTKKALWGQIWFVAEAGDVPHNVVMVTYIKGRSLSDFNSLVASIQARGIEPAEGIFVPEFVKHSGQKPDDNGVMKPISYYSLEWDWVERKNWKMAEQVAPVLKDPQTLSRLVDSEGTREMICVDNLSPQGLACLMAAHSKAEVPVR